MALAGDRLGNFDLIRPIAAGGTAELYLARAQGLEGFERLVVVKRLLPQLAPDPARVKRFLDEARVAATLHHPHIAQVHAIAVEDGEAFVSMEYIHGEDLARLHATAIEHGVPVALDAVLALVTGVCAGLHYAHTKAGPAGRPLGIVHRAVAPSNVLVTYDGGVKLVDFRSATPDRELAYLSPEQCRGEAVDRRSDIYSLGTILYELTTGRLPFAEAGEDAVRAHIAGADVPPPRTFVPSYAPALEAIVLRALARDPARRFASALELQQALEGFARDSELGLSPLALARLMSTLFPARLEEWAQARAQGAFFVEEHVLRMLEPREPEPAPAPEPEPEPEPAYAVPRPGVLVAHPREGVRATRPARAHARNDETVFVRTDRRSRAPLYIALAILLAGAGAAAFVAFGGASPSDAAGEVHAHRPAAAAPVVEPASAPPAAEPTALPALAPAASPALAAPAASPALAAPAAPAPTEPTVATPAEPQVAPRTDEPAPTTTSPKKKPARKAAAKKPRRTKTARPAATEPTKEPTWNADSPFLPVRQ